MTDQVWTPIAATAAQKISELALEGGIFRALALHLEPRAVKEHRKRMMALQEKFVSAELTSMLDAGDDIRRDTEFEDLERRAALADKYEQRAKNRRVREQRSLSTINKQERYDLARIDVATYQAIHGRTHGANDEDAAPITKFDAIVDLSAISRSEDDEELGD